MNEDEDLDFSFDGLDKMIPSFNSEKLCQIIVCNRYFNFNQELAILCMEELSNRRLNGDNFEFELYIDNSLKELPPLNFSFPDLRTVLNQFIGSKK